MSYTDLTDEQKLEEAIRFVAEGQPLPAALAQFLKDEDLYEAITSRGKPIDDNNRIYATSRT